MLLGWLLLKTDLLFNFNKISLSILIKFTANQEIWLMKYNLITYDLSRIDMISMSHWQLRSDLHRQVYCLISICSTFTSSRCSLSHIVLQSVIIMFSLNLPNSNLFYDSYVCSTSHSPYHGDLSKYSNQWLYHETEVKCAKICKDLHNLYPSYNQGNFTFLKMIHKPKSFHNEKCSLSLQRLI